MLTPQTVDVIEAALKGVRTGHMEAELNEKGEYTGKAHYVPDLAAKATIDAALAELAALRTERQGQAIPSPDEERLSIIGRMADYMMLHFEPGAIEWTEAQLIKSWLESSRTERQGQQVNENGLLPCPLCGSKAEIGENGDNSPNWFVSCSKWTCCILDGFPSEEAVVAMWNRRTAPPATPVGTQWVRVPDTMGEINDDDLPLHYLHTNEGDLVYLDGEWRHLPIGYAVFYLTQQEGNSNE